MAKKKAALFEPLVPEDKRHPAFEQIRTRAVSYPARTLMTEVWADFEDKDGNFVRDFQTAGFDARVFELYLFAYFSRSGYAIDFSYNRPDFLVERNSVRVAIEATTSSRPDPFVIEELLEPSTEEIARKQRDEIPVRLGSPLFSKLQKKYWELPQVAGLPFVIAIEAFHDTTALFFPGMTLANYLYGLEHFPKYTEDGQLLIESAPIATHERPGKTPIPSNFFAQPGAEHVSAILFTNSGTYSKFNRIGLMEGHYRGDLKMVRTGTCWNPDPNASTPLPFAYDIGQRPTMETWGEGIEVYHNPNALIPLPRTFFRHASDSILTEAKTITSRVPDFHPFTSHTISIHHNSIPEFVEVDGVRVDLISAREFNDLKPITEEEAERLELFAEEVEWWADSGRSYIASVLHDFTDDTFVAVILARDPAGVFRPVDVDSDLPDREAARQYAVHRIAANQRLATIALA